MLILKFTRVAKPVFTFRGKTGQVVEMVQRGGASTVGAVVGPPGTNITISTELPSGGSNGDVWFRYTV